MTYAKIVADSTYEGGTRLTTMEIRFHRFVLAEFNTHRVFSRNSASSRAIPVAKQLARIKNDPATPLVFPAEKKGMQGGDALGAAEETVTRHLWKEAREDAVGTAQLLTDLGLHKSVTNRLVEPFMWHTVVVTATAWQNFFALRDNAMAQPEIRAVAEQMQTAYEQSTPEVLAEGLWHLPYIDNQDREWAAYRDPDRALGHSAEPTLARISSARCARVSYLTQDGKRDHAADLSLYDRLTTAWPMHSSPLEHVATPAPENSQKVTVWSKTGPQEAVMSLTLPRYGNLLGWHSHRFDVEACKGYQAFS